LTATTVPSPRDKKTSRLTKSSKILKTIIKAIQDKKGERLVLLDMRKIPEAVADFFLICEATTNVQVRAIAHNIEDEVKKECGENPYRHEGHLAMQWVLIDYVNIVVHVFQPEQRKFYRLEEMWSDAGITEFADETAPVTGKGKEKRNGRKANH
jgi:ribosome-associated protein